MKKRLLISLLLLVLILLMAGCGCEHEWLAATCAAPKTCQLCGEAEGESLPHTWQDATCSAAKTCTVCSATEGEPLPHTWQDATCTVAKTCTVCQTTEGEPLPHTWQDASCTAAKVCTVCQITEGEALGHNWQDATCTAPKTCSVCQVTEGKTAAHKWQEATTDAPKTCSVCKKTSGSKLNTDARFTTKSTQALQGTWYCDVVMTDDMTGLANFGGVDCTLTMKFGNTGTLISAIKIKDEAGYLKKLKAYTVEQTYASFTQQGMTKEQADQAMLATYGLTVPEYVDAALKNYNVNELFQAFNAEEVYYVEGSKVFTALSWKAKFESNEFTISGGKLVIEGVSLVEGGPALQWQKG